MGAQLAVVTVMKPFERIVRGFSGRNRWVRYAMLYGVDSVELACVSQCKVVNSGRQIEWSYNQVANRWAIIRQQGGPSYQLSASDTRRRVSVARWRLLDHQYHAVTVPVSCTGTSG